VTDPLPPHPGTVEYVDGATGEVTRTVPADDLPDDLTSSRGSTIGGPS
jgi:hypothetical protein